MKIFLGIIVVLLLGINSTHGLWSSKCKDAETSADKVIRLIQNANCTLREESKRFYENLNNFRDGMRSKMEAFKEIFKNNIDTSGNEGLDHAIDIRMSKDTNGRGNSIEDLNSRRKRNESEEIEDENEQTTEPTNQETTTEENYEGVVDPQKLNILIAPSRCRNGQRFMSGRCRTLVEFN